MSYSFDILHYVFGLNAIFYAFVSQNPSGAVLSWSALHFAVLSEKIVYNILAHNSRMKRLYYVWPLNILLMNSKFLDETVASVLVGRL